MSTRIPVTLIEIDQDQCALTFGQGACPATGEPCFNTRATCKALDAYTLGEPLTLRFSYTGRINSHPYEHIPSITGHSTTPTRINVGARQGDDKPLGRRSTLSVQMQDLPYNDRLTDPYVDQRSYNPLERGTFWSKWLARNPYHNKRPIRLIEGYEGQSLSDMQTRHYVIDKVTHPDANGKVEVKALDVLRLADDDKAKAPALSTGVLVGDIDENATSLLVGRAGIEQYTTGYGVNNLIRIGDEIIRYSGISTAGNGDILIGGLTRGVAGSEVQAHDADDTVQVCLEFNGAPPWEIADGLLNGYANIPAEFIDYAAGWLPEATRWLSGLTASRIISEPTGVNELVGELCEQALFFIWWDDRVQRIRFQAVRPAEGEVLQITERDHIIEGSFRTKTRPDERASEVWVSIEPIDATETDEKRKNFRQTFASIDTDAQSPFEYDERKIYEVYSLWLRAENQVSLLGSRLLARYRETPRYIEFELDAKDRDLALGQPFDVFHRSNVNQFGETVPVRYQVISQHEPVAGDTIKIEAQLFDFAVGERRGNWMNINAPSYANADDEERTTGFFWSRVDGTMLNNDDGYLWS